MLREDAFRATAANMNITANGSSSWSCYSLINPLAEKRVQTVASGLILVVLLVGNSFIVIIVFKTPTLRKPMNFMIVNMAISDLLFTIFLFPLSLVEMQADSWLIGDSLLQTLCKQQVVTLRVCASRWTEVCGGIGSQRMQQRKMAPLLKITIVLVICSIFVECR